MYAVMILGFIWLTKDMTFASLTADPLFATYSIAVVFYVLGRFVFALAYRSVPDSGFRPTVSIVVPAFNEEEGIIGTIESCMGVDYPADLLEVIVVNDGSTDGTWARILQAKARWPQLYASTSAATTASGAPWRRGSGGPRATCCASSTRTPT